MITERSGYVLLGTDAYLWLAELALEGLKSEDKSKLGNKEAALQHAKEALTLDHCKDSLPYYYKVAYEEAERLLERLK
jgi:hypothetical protein